MAHMFSDKLLRGAISFKVISSYNTYKIKIYYARMWPFNTKTIKYPYSHPSDGVSIPDTLFIKDIDYLVDWFTNEPN